MPVGTQLTVKEEASESGQFQADITGVPGGKQPSYSRNQNGPRENPGAIVRTGHQDGGTLAHAGHGDKAVCRY